MNRKPSLVFLSAVLFAGMLASGCAGSPQPPISVSVSPSSAETDIGQTVRVTATVANDASGKGVTWSLSGVGSLTSRTATSVTYSAPSSGYSSNPVLGVVTATSVADTMASASTRSK